MALSVMHFTHIISSSSKYYRHHFTAEEIKTSERPNDMSSTKHKTHTFHYITAKQINKNSSLGKVLSQYAPQKLIYPGQMLLVLTKIRYVKDRECKICCLSQSWFTSTDPVLLSGYLSKSANGSYCFRLATVSWAATLF